MTYDPEVQKERFERLAQWLGIPKEKRSALWGFIDENAKMAVEAAKKIDQKTYESQKHL